MARTSSTDRLTEKNVSFNFSVIGVVSGVKAGRSGVRIPAGVRDKTLLQDVQTFSAAHSASNG